MTWQEIGRIDFRNTLVLVPVGATEQHGPHLPTDTDTMIVSRLAEEVERRAPEKVLLTPTMWLGHSPHHLSFGGTLSVDHVVYISMIRSICSSYVGMGAQKICILNGHGGNHAPLSIVLQELKNEHKGTLILSTEYWNVANEEIGNIRDSGFGGLGHACELETSLYLYFNESKVRRQLIQDDGNQPKGSLFRLDMLKGNPASRVFNFEELTASGVFGKPSMASREKGKRFFHAISDKLEQFTEEVLEMM